MLSFEYDMAVKLINSQKMGFFVQNQPQNQAKWSSGVEGRSALSPGPNNYQGAIESW